MAKSSRASTVKTNNQRLKSKVFGPVEQARMERLSAKLLEVATAPKPPKPEQNEMKVVDEKEEEVQAEENAADDTMDLDNKPAPSKRTSGRITKKKKSSKIVFPKYGDRKKTGFSTKKRKTA